MDGAVIRILHVIQELRTGGAERVVLELARAGVARGDAVAVAAASGEHDDEFSALRAGPRYLLPMLHRRPSSVPVGAWALRRAMREFRPEVVHAHNPGMALITSLATVRGRFTPSLVSVHGLPESEWPAAARTLRLAGLPSVACGPGVANAMSTAGCRPCRTVMNGIAPGPNAVPERSQLWGQWGLPESARVLLVVGRLAPQKNQQLAIRALSLLPDDVHLVLIGDGDCRDDLERTATAAGVDARVVFAGNRPGRAIMPLADVNLSCSHWEGMPLAIVEAMTSGRPVVATAVRGISELLTNGEDAVLVRPNQPGELAAGIRRVLDDSRFAESIAARAQRHASELTTDRMVEGYYEVYRDIVT